MRYRWSQDVLRILCYVSGGFAVAIMPWYFGFPLLVLGIFLGQCVEDVKSKQSEGEKDGN